MRTLPAATMIRAGLFAISSLALFGLTLSGCGTNPVSYDPTAPSAQPEEAALVTTVKVTVTTDGHGVTSASSATVNRGASFWLSAAPKMGYEFSAWTVTAGSATFTYGNEAITKVNVSNVNTTVKANFKAVDPRIFKLTMTSDGHGTTFPGGVSSINLGQTIYLTALPAAGYVFSSWTCTAGKVTFATAGGGQFHTVKLVGGGATVKANFKKKS